MERSGEAFTVRGESKHSLARSEPVPRPPAISDRIDAVKPKFPGKPEGRFFQKPSQTTKAHV